MRQRTHVQAASNAGALQRLVGGVLLASSHETGHLVLGELDLAAAEGGQRDVGDLELVGGGRHDCRVIGGRRGMEREEKDGRERVVEVGKKWCGRDERILGARRYFKDPTVGILPRSTPAFGARGRAAEAD